MIHSKIGGELVADHMRRPIHDHALREPFVERLRGGPHDVASSDVGVGIGHHQLALAMRNAEKENVVDEDVEKSLGVAILHVSVCLVGRRIGGYSDTR